MALGETAPRKDTNIFDGSTAGAVHQTAMPGAWEESLVGDHLWLAATLGRSGQTIATGRLAVVSVLDGFALASAFFETAIEPSV
jgi:hypothetical protein